MAFDGFDIKNCVGVKEVTFERQDLSQICDIPDHYCAVAEESAKTTLFLVKNDD
jgi:hypothetical protein